MKVLIIEDNTELQEIISQALISKHFIVEIAPDSATAMEKIGLYEYSCILLDIMLPDGSGLDLLKKLKNERKTTGVIIISAKDSLEDKIKGLDLGADDYLPKPFHIAELISRVNSIIRRKSNAGQLTIEYGNVRIEPDIFKVYIADNETELLKKEFLILKYFIERNNIVISKEMLAEAIWGDYIDQVDNFDFLYAQLKNLRAKLKSANADITIKTVYGIGYKLTLEA